MFVVICFINDLHNCFCLTDDSDQIVSARGNFYICFCRHLIGRISLQRQKQKVNEKKMHNSHYFLLKKPHSESHYGCKMRKWKLTRGILSTSCMFKCVSFQTCPHCSVGQLWVRNGSLPQAVSLCGESCVDGMLGCLFSVQAHCLLSRVFVYSVSVCVCACVCFWLNQQC